MTGEWSDKIGNHRRACAEHGVTPQTERYLSREAEQLEQRLAALEGH
ncbi:MAG: hypothetical protein HYY78_15640 [Betaproteobacteria bacterium]|nr:hypothetical protein [Betaproteobacteria bacterium]